MATIDPLRIAQDTLNPVRRLAPLADLARRAGSDLGGGGAAFGVYPQMPRGGTQAPQPLASQAQVRAVDNDPANTAAIGQPLSALATQPSATPTPAPAASPGAADTPQLPVAPGRPLSDVARTGNSYSGGDVSGQISVNGQAPGGSYAEALGTKPAGAAAAPTPLSARATPNADAVLAASNPLNQGAGVIDSVGTDARQKFFDEANLRNVANRGAAPGKYGAAAFAQELDAAQQPLIARARQQTVDSTNNAATQRTQLEQTGADNRAAMTERSADARFGIANAQNQVQNNLAERRLGIEDRRATAAEAAAGVPSGYQRQQDGSLAFIKGGPADPETAKGKNALNDTQAKALQFGTRMQESGKLLDSLAAQGVDQPGLLKRAGDAVGVGGLLNGTQSAQQQQVEQAQRDFINATLRRESGAAISPAEFENGKRQYFPQPLDKPDVIAQKKANRELSTRGILAEVPNAEQRVAQILPQGQPAAQAGAAGAAAAPSLPGGMSRQVGTSGGKPVYEDAQGNRFIGG